MADSGPEPEETAVGTLDHACPCNLLRPGTEPAPNPSRGTAPALEAGGKMGDGAEGGPTRIVPTAGLPGQGDVRVEDGPPAIMDEEMAHGCAMQGEDTDTACAGADGSGAEAECLLPRGREEGVEGLPPAGHPGEKTGNRPDPLLGKDAGRRESVCLLEGEEEEGEEEDQALGSTKQVAPAESFCLQVEGREDEAECPICTEPYDQEGRLPTLLNCSHSLCARCLRAILEVASAADIGRVRCPICRQKTPLVEWEIYRLQEELMLLGAAPDPSSAGPPVASFSPLPIRRPGFWGSLEYRFQLRFHTTRMVGFLPCLRYPPHLIGRLARLEHRCPSGYRLALLGLLLAELLSLLLVFLPIAVLLLLFLILER